MDYDFINNDSKLFSKKNIITFLILLILIVAIPLGVRLVQTQQIFRSGAAGDPITFPDLKQNINGESVTQSPTFKVQVNSPFGPATP